jgi:hypothetical protein
MNAVASLLLLLLSYRKPIAHAQYWNWYPQNNMFHYGYNYGSKSTKWGGKSSKRYNNWDWDWPNYSRPNNYWSSPYKPDDDDRPTEKPNQKPNKPSKPNKPNSKCIMFMLTWRSFKELI